MILTGHVIDCLREMRDNSVHCVVTSPPYWSQRDYGTPPVTWGGAPTCDHQWASLGQFRRDGGTERAASGNYANGIAPGSPNGLKSHRAIDSSRGDHCGLCGAWRGQLGLEPTPEMFVAHIIEVFREVRRVLRNDGTCWLNMGDSYANDAKGPRGINNSSLNSPGWHVIANTPGTKKEFRTSSLGIKRKDLVGIPWLVALALRGDGWFLRGDIIWHKPTAMPMSVRDRPTTDHEYVFLLSKRPTYFYDPVAVQVESSTNSHRRGAGINPKAKVPSGWDTGRGNHGGIVGRYRSRRNADFCAKVSGLVTHRNLRTVWRIAAQAFKGKHFATYPPRLVENCIKAGTSEAGCCPTCGSPWRRITRKSQVPRHPDRISNDSGDQPDRHDVFGTHDLRQLVITTETLGWYPACRCYGIEPLPKITRRPRKQADQERWEKECARIHSRRAALCVSAEQLPRIPAVVFDPFLGSGTTALVAEHLHRDWIGIELKEEYAAIAKERIEAGYAPRQLPHRQSVKKSIPHSQQNLFH